MKKIQKIIIVIYLAVIMTACLYVPWKVEDPEKSEPYDRLPLYQQCSPFWEPILKTTFPLTKEEIEEEKELVELGIIESVGTRAECTFYRTINFKQILAEIVAITAVFAILFVLTLRPKKVLPGS